MAFFGVTFNRISPSSSCFEQAEQIEAPEKLKVSDIRNELGIMLDGDEQ